MAKDRLSGKLAVILHADVAGSTQLVQQDEQLAHERIQDAFRRFSGTIAKYNGRVQELRGDALLAEFERASDAVTAALSFQSDHHDHLAILDDDIRPNIRVGIALGEVIIADNTITGAGVVLAQRVEQLAEPGGLCITSAIHEALPNRMPFSIESLGEQALKGFDDHVRVYRVQLSTGESVPPPQQKSPRQVTPKYWWQMVSIAVVVMLVAAGFGYWSKYSLPQEETASIESMAFPLPDKPSIAVLPFTNMSGDAEQEYFADGITEDIITELSRFGLFFVISRNSTFTYKGTSVDIRKVADTLGAQYVLEGSVRKSSDRIRVSAQLIDAINDKHVWAEKYDRELKEIFQIQDEITESIVASVAPEYLSAEFKRSKRKTVQNLDAWDAFMRGYWHLLRFTEVDNAKSQQLVRTAINLDSQRSNYYAVLAVTYLMDAFYGWGDSRDASFSKANENAEHALALDDQDTQAIRTIGLVNFFSKNHDTALSYYQRAVEVNPNEAENWALLGAAEGVSGDYDSALEKFNTAFRLSPNDVHIVTWYNYLAVAAFVVGRDEDAADWARKTIQANPGFSGGYRTLAASYGNLGQHTDAEAARVKLQELLPHLTITKLRESLPYFIEPDMLERYLNGLRRAGLPE